MLCCPGRQPGLSCGAACMFAAAPVFEFRPDLCSVKMVVDVFSPGPHQSSRLNLPHGFMFLIEHAPFLDDFDCGDIKTKGWGSLLHTCMICTKSWGCWAVVSQ